MIVLSEKQAALAAKTLQMQLQLKRGFYAAYRTNDCSLPCAVLLSACVRRHANGDKYFHGLIAQSL